ncbi:MAG: alpha/beta hydrolase [Candidatus Syntropharchaeales archaeon]
MGEISFNGIRATERDVSDRGVVLCPPHPLYGGNRHDIRLVKICEELSSHGISSLSIDYKRYTGGIKEIEDVLFAIEYFKKKKKSVGLLGYSFGAVVASNAVSDDIKGLVLISVLKEIDKIRAKVDSDVPKLFIHGKKDLFAPFSDFKILYEEAKGEKECILLDTDHFYLGKIGELSRNVSSFFRRIL